MSALKRGMFSLTPQQFLLAGPCCLQGPCCCWGKQNAASKTLSCDSMGADRGVLRT